MKITILGRGKVGHGLARALRSAPSTKVRVISARSKPRGIVNSDVIVLAVPDNAIATCASLLAPKLGPSAVVLHCAGARGADELHSCRRAGAATGVLHPLVSFSDRRRSPPLEGTTFVIAGDRRATRAGRAIARACGGRPVHAEVHGAAYHAAAALVANGAAALAFAGVRVLQRLGLSARDAERATGGLLATVAANVERVGVPGALTGPVVRGDADAVEAHRRALDRLDRNARYAYDGIAPAVMRCAKEAGLSRAQARAIRGALSKKLTAARSRR